MNSYAKAHDSVINKFLETKPSKNKMLKLVEELSKQLREANQEKQLLQCRVETYDNVEKLENQGLLDKIAYLSYENDRIKFGLEEEEMKNEDMRKEVSALGRRVAEEIHQRETLHESWKSTLGEVIKNYNDKLKEVETKLKESEQREKDAQALYQHQSLEVSKINIKNLKLLLDKNKKLTIELKEAKVEDCPICFEEISEERKWTAFLPCGHRTCSECADKISHLPRATNRRKCPNCRENINCSLVLEGIYDS